MYHTSPSLTHLRVFACLAFASEVRKTDKFAPKAFPTVFLGYSTLQKGYKLFSLHTKEFLVSRDVVFQEEVFPFQHNTSSCSPLFPIVQLTSTSIDSSSPVEYTPTAAPPDCSSHTPHASSPDCPSHPVSPSSTSSEVVLTVVLPDTTLSLRRSSRPYRPPIWHHDFLLSKPKSFCLYPLSNHVSYHCLSAKYGAALAAYSSISEPTSFHEASLDPLWVQVMLVEITALEENTT